MFLLMYIEQLLTYSVLTFLLLLQSVEVHPSMKLGSDQLISIVAVQVKKEKPTTRNTLQRMQVLKMGQMHWGYSVLPMH